jgi:peptide-methionine (R)-S-oxide reductase
VVIVGPGDGPGRPRACPLVVSQTFKLVATQGATFSEMDTEREMNLTDEQWRARLTPEQYEVLRRHGTERPFTGEYVDIKDDGTYRCAGCGAELFSSDTKFESGTGWPSFYEPAVAENVELHQDQSYGMTRTEVL